MRNSINWQWIVVVLFFAPALPAAADEPPLNPDEGLPVIDWSDAGKYVDQQVVVQGKIEATGRSRTITFLNFDRQRSFTAIVRKNDYGNFPTPPDVMYSGKWVRIRGRISTYREKPQIEVTRPDQVTIIDGPGPTTTQPAQPKREFTGVVTLATYNVLNLFDAQDDPYHNDEGTPAKPRDQLEHLAATIRSVDADVLALEEVENRGYLEQFVHAMLGDMGYEHVVLIEGNDGRGIDCAVLSRLPVGPVTSYRHLRFPDAEGAMTSFRRDLLRVRIEPPGATAFDVFVVHLKSKRGGGETETVRLGEARAARRILDETLAADAGACFVICGDFNDTWDSRSLRAIRGDGATALRTFVDAMPAGTATYNREPHRSMIDFILCSPAMASRYVENSLRVVGGSVESSGSDHNPVVMRFDLKRRGADDEVARSAEAAPAGE